MLAVGVHLYDVYGVPGQLLAIVLAAAAVLVGAAVVVFLIRKARLRRRKLRAFDPCQRCGFDLRATTGPCPECGTPRPKPPQTPQNELFDDFEDEPWRAS